MTIKEAQQIIDDAGFTGVTVTNIDNDCNVIGIEFSTEQPVDPIASLFEGWRISLQIVDSQ